jgi:hypothetical protein
MVQSSLTWFRDRGVYTCMCVCFVVLLAGPVAHLVRGLCGRVLNNMMEDLRAEVARRHQLEAGQTVHNTGREEVDCAWIGVAHSQQLEAAGQTAHYTASARRNLGHVRLCWR